ncbi:unnamed protein product [Polarella glacialis]|uniref:GAF domain-containing protein n=1 Tax=Polarella glacialis TaxID=89957 RepID=A0A813GG70_POLGL|nr:unnamed protein product [Polarella glacialis]
MVGSSPLQKLLDTTPSMHKLILDDLAMDRTVTRHDVKESACDETQSVKAFAKRGRRKNHFRGPSQIEAVLAEVCSYFQVAACALVTPSGLAYKRVWHIADGSRFQSPRSKELQGAFFRMLANPDMPLVVQDATDYCPSLPDRLEPYAPFRFYAEAPVRGKSTLTILGTLCLADSQVFDLDGVQRDQLQNYADILYKLLLEGAGLESESDDFMLPHLTHPSKQVSDWQCMVDLD